MIEFAVNPESALPAPCEEDFPGSPTSPALGPGICGAVWQDACNKETWPCCGLGQSPGKEISHCTEWKVGRVFLFPLRHNNCSIWGLKSFSDTNLLSSKKACGRNLDLFPILRPLAPLLFHDHFPCCRCAPHRRAGPLTADSNPACLPVLSLSRESVSAPRRSWVGH